MTSATASRQCGECSLCCKVMWIEALSKPVGAWCPHCAPKRGCAIYDGRPSECESFNCVWLVNELLDERWKPSKAKFVLTTSDDGIKLRCDPGFPNAWRREPYYTEIREWAIAGEDSDLTVLIIIGRRMILVTGAHEFDLGIVGADERIVREIEDGRVVNATVVKADEVPSGPSPLV
jgi:hypothetical protein